MPTVRTATHDDDPLAELLGEALRRGPGSPEWHDAVSRLRESDSAETDETRLLLQARERLAAGQAYREVRAGPGFTRALFDHLNAPPAKPRSLLIWTIGFICATAILGSLIALLTLVSKSQLDDVLDKPLAELLFISPREQYAFVQPQSVGFKVDQSWSIDRGAGIRPAGPTEAQRLELPMTFQTDEPICVECVVDIRRETDTHIALLAMPAGGGRGMELEIGWREVTAGPGDAVRRTSREAKPGTYVLRLKMGRDETIAEIDGKVVWSGPIDYGRSGKLAIEFRSVDRDPGAMRVEALRVLAVAPGGAGR